MVKLLLNLKKPNNYAFFCPVSKLHLTVGNPSGFADGVTPAITRGIKSGVLIDVDGVVDVNTGTIVNGTQHEDGTGINMDSGTGSVSEDGADGTPENGQKTKSRQRKSKSKENE